MTWRFVINQNFLFNVLWVKQNSLMGLKMTLYHGFFSDVECWEWDFFSVLMNELHHHPRNSWSRIVYLSIQVRSINLLVECSNLEYGTCSTYLQSLIKSNCWYLKLVPTWVCNNWEVLNIITLHNKENLASVWRLTINTLKIKLISLSWSRIENWECYSAYLKCLEPSYFIEKLSCNCQN